MNIYRIIQSLSLLVLFSCTTNTVNTNFISIKNGKFIDSKNRTIILNGINHVTKNKETNYINNNDSILFVNFKKYGFNCIRYGISWAALEPKPNEIDENYLKEIDKRIKWAKDNNLLLILDMHQDLYSVKYGNGAPEWATLDNGCKHIEGEIWSDAYIISPAVKTCFDNFWDNKPAKDGIGLQDHYSHVWKVIADRYKNYDNVIGFDIMNEPFTGSMADSVINNLISGLVRHCTESANIKADNINSIFDNTEERLSLLKILNNKEIFKDVVNQSQDLIDSFEQKTLSNFYQKVRDSIRSVNNRHILFLEHCYFGNMGLKSSFKIPVDSNGNPDSQCAYAPHVYDLNVDTNNSNTLESNRLDFIFSQVIVSAKERNLPVWLGEWGAFYDINKKYNKVATFHKDIIENNLMGQAYWSWWNNIELQDYFYTCISRSYPRYICGNLIKYKNTDNMFVCTWEEDSDDNVSCIYLTDVSNLKESDINLNPISDYNIKTIENSKGGYLIIKSINKKRELTIKY